MKNSIFYLTAMVFSLILFSCQKDEVISTELQNTESSSLYSNVDIQPEESSGKKEKAACTKIYLYTEYITVSHDDYEAIKESLLNSGVSFVAPVCNVFYYQSASSFPGWIPKVENSIDVLMVTNDDITFRINNLLHVCYWCPVGQGGQNLNSFCNHNGSTIHVALGNNGCLLGNFTLNVSTDQYVELDFSAIMDFTQCQALDCGGSGV